jgi:murein L,D-transpeptidase YafK
MRYARKVLTGLLAVVIICGLCAGLFFLMAGHATQENLRSSLAGLLPGRQAALRGLNPVPIAQRLAEKGFALGQPAYLRIFKEEKILEVWMERNGGFELALTYPICAWSGQLGPKLKEGDGQSPEGFYLVSRNQLNPHSHYYLALNIGFPNAFDSAAARTGSALMIHGACASIGCYAMTDAGIDDIYAIVDQALSSGQDAVPVHIFPFRMTEQRLAAAAAAPWADFWQNLAMGESLFKPGGQPPQAYSCSGRYGFAAGGTAAPTGCSPVIGW